MGPGEQSTCWEGGGRAGTRLTAPGREPWVGSLAETVAPPKAPKVVGEAAGLAQCPALSGPLSPPRGQALAYLPLPLFLALSSTREGLGPFGTLPRGRGGFLAGWPGGTGCRSGGGGLGVGGGLENCRQGAPLAARCMPGVQRPSPSPSGFPSSSQVTQPPPPPYLQASGILGSIRLIRYEYDPPLSFHEEGCGQILDRQPKSSSDMWPFSRRTFVTDAEALPAPSSPLQPTPARAVGRTAVPRVQLRTLRTAEGGDLLMSTVNPAAELWIAAWCLTAHLGSCEGASHWLRCGEQAV